MPPEGSDLIFDHRHNACIWGVVSCSEMEDSEAAVISGQEAAGVPGVNLAHVVRIWRGVRRKRGTDFTHEGKGRLRRGPQSQHPGLFAEGITEAVPVTAGRHEHRSRGRLL